MRQAFIIMQIGNPDLDMVCERAIVPALKSCGLDPKRVDKHNEGRLLKSEIVRFIESSDIIVADLTNERPNCYLEVGYAMGLDKFQNLVLMAREDHSQDSPNYQKDGPKIHFDLSGYDILFWKKDDLNGLKEELEKRVRRRLENLTSDDPPSSASSWDEEWLHRHYDLALSKLEIDDRRGFMEIRMMLPDIELDIGQRELLRVADQARIHTFGRPIAPMFNDREYRPKPSTDGIVNEIDVDGYDYWTIRKDGTFYTLKSLFEDRQELGHIFFFNTRIVRITEALLYSLGLYSGLNVPQDSRILMGIRHGGLEGRILSSAVGYHHLVHEERRSTQDEVYTEVDTTLEKIKPDLVDIVQRFTQPLLIIFDYFEVERTVLENIVNNYVAGKVT